MGSKKFDLRRFIKIAYDLAQPRKVGSEKLHDCSIHDYGVDWDDFRILCGGAIFDCLGHEGGKLYVNNGEYGNRVNYCPFCGYKAKKQMKLKKG